MRISDWSSDVCSSDLRGDDRAALEQRALHQNHNPSPFALSLSKGAVLSFGGARRRTVLRQAQHERKEGRCRFIVCCSKISAYSSAYARIKFSPSTCARPPSVYFAPMVRPLPPFPPPILQDREIVSMGMGGFICENHVGR